MPEEAAEISQMPAFMSVCNAYKTALDACYITQAMYDARVKEARAKYLHIYQDE